MNKAFFLDRDGIINELIINSKEIRSPKNLNELTLKRGIINISNFLKSKGYYLIMITNQPDVSRKKLSMNQVIKINNYIKKKIKLDDTYVCYCSNNSCINRKPNNGMIKKAIEKWQINISKSYMIGDREKDIQAGKKSKIKTIFLKNNYYKCKKINPNFSINNLKEIKSIVR